MSRKFTGKRFQLKGARKVVRCLFGSKGKRNEAEVLTTAPLAPAVKPAPKKRAKKSTK
jgi:hypothetical protein